MSNIRYKELVLVVRLVLKFFSEECYFCGIKKKKVSEVKYV